MERPPYRPKTPIKCCGPYAGAGDPKVKEAQWDEIGEDLYNSGYNELSLFLTLDTPLKFYPWPKVDGVWDYTVIREDWRNHIYTLMDRLAFWRISPKIKFVDQYHAGNANDPFGKLNVEQLYSSWDGSSYVWLKWDELTPRKYTNFRPTSEFGKGMIKYIEAVAEIAKQVALKYKDFRLVITWANETMAVFEGSATHPSKTRGDRDEVLYWVQGVFEKQGFIENKNLLVEVDYLAFRPNVRTVDYHIMSKVSQDLTRKGMRLEIHGILSINDIKKYISAGVNPKTSLFSTDGDLRMVADYKELGHSSYHTDLKLDCKPGQPFFPTNFMKFWRTYFPPYRGYIK